MALTLETKELEVLEVTYESDLDLIIRNNSPLGFVFFRNEKYLEVINWSTGQKALIRLINPYVREYIGKHLDLDKKRLTLYFTLECD